MRLRLKPLTGALTIRLTIAFKLTKENILQPISTSVLARGIYWVLPAPCLPPRSHRSDGDAKCEASCSEDGQTDGARCRRRRLPQVPLHPTRSRCTRGRGRRGSDCGISVPFPGSLTFHSRRASTEARPLSSHTPSVHHRTVERSM